MAAVVPHRIGTRNRFDDGFRQVPPCPLALPGLARCATFLRANAVDAELDCSPVARGELFGVSRRPD